MIGNTKRGNFAHWASAGSFDPAAVSFVGVLCEASRTSYCVPALKAGDEYILSVQMPRTKSSTF